MVPDRPGGSDDGVGDLDAILSVLADERRRCALRVLYQADGALDVDELARRVVVGPAPPTPGTSGRIDSVRVRLHHVDLPKLDRVGLVAYDRDRGTVVPDAEPDAVTRVLGTAGWD